jgi:hypothetical protein
MSTLNIIVNNSPQYSSKVNDCPALTSCPGYSAVSLKSYDASYSGDVKRLQQDAQDGKAWNKFIRRTSFAIHLFVGIIFGPIFILIVAFLSLLELAADTMTKPEDP